MVAWELPSSGDLDLCPGTDAPTTLRATSPPTTPSTGKSHYTLNWEEPPNGFVGSSELRWEEQSAGDQEHA